MASLSRRLLLAPRVAKLRIELSWRTRILERHTVVEIEPGTGWCEHCGLPDPCPTRVVQEQRLEQMLDEMHELTRKALA